MYALEIRNLDFNYEKELILNDLSLTIEEGKFISIIWPNGSGKSTLLKTLANLYKPKAGTITLNNKNINSFNKKHLERIMALVPQDTVIDYDFTVEEIVMMGRYPYKGRFERESDKDRSITKEVLELTNTYYLRKRPITEISGGERQRVIIARALAQEPSIILLDEPTSNLDINHQIEILNLLKDLNRNKKTTVVLVIHDINLAARYSDEIILLHEGRVLGQGSPEKIITKSKIEKVYKMEVAIEKNKFTKAIYVTPLGRNSD